MIISNQIKAHLKGSTVSFVGTRDKDFMTDILKTVGVIPVSHDSVKFFIAEKTASQTLENIRSNKIVSLSCTNVITHESYQLKGRLLRVTPAGETDYTFIKDYILMIDGAITKTGLRPGLIKDHVLYKPALAIEFIVEQIFDQTPKVGTGQLISTP